MGTINYNIIHLESELESFSWNDGLHAIIKETVDEIHLCRLDKKTGEPTLFDDGRFMCSITSPLNPGITKTNFKLSWPRTKSPIEEPKTSLGDIERVKEYANDLVNNEIIGLDEVFLRHLKDAIEDYERPNTLPEAEQKIFRRVLKYYGWDNIEQMEDVIGEQESTEIYFGDVDDKRINYDLEIILKRVRRSDLQR